MDDAKKREPGHLSLPEDEMLHVEIDGREARMIGAVAASVGVLPIPRAIEVADFLSALRAVHRHRAVFFGVDIETLYSADQGKLRRDDVVLHDMPVDELFSRAIQVPDGSETFPLQRIAARRMTT